MRFGDEADLEEFIRDLIQKAVRHANDTSPRSLQKELGPSQISHVCDRSLVYQMVRGPGSSRFDPWPAIVGTAIHAYLERAVPEYGRLTGVDLEAEREVQVAPGVIGHSDLYVAKTVVDYKGVSKERMKKYLASGPPDNYRTQVQLYGLGFINDGYEVENVALVFLPRDGQLRNAHVWVEPYDQQVASDAIARYQRLSGRIAASDFSDPTIWGRIPATTGDHCGICPWYQVGGAVNQDGCPGR